jgi:hypothetical protein
MVSPGEVSESGDDPVLAHAAPRGPADAIVAIIVTQAAARLMSLFTRSLSPRNGRR